MTALMEKLDVNTTHQGSINIDGTEYRIEQVDPIINIKNHILFAENKIYSDSKFIFTEGNAVCLIYRFWKSDNCDTLRLSWLYMRPDERYHAYRL